MPPRFLSSTYSPSFLALAPLEPDVLSLLFMLFGLAVVMALVLWLASLFFQSYLYTQPGGGLMWQAPIVAVVMTFFFLFWSLLNVWGAIKVSSTKVEVPYGLLWEFSNRIDVVPEPVPEILSKKRNDP